jgi:hypothetical protein
MAASPARSLPRMRSSRVRALRPSEGLPSVRHERLHGGAATREENMKLISKAELWRVNDRRAGSTDGGNSQEDRGRRSGDTEGLRGTREYPAGPGAAAPHKSELTIAEPDFSVSCGFSASRGFCFSLFCSCAWVKRSRKARARIEGAFLVVQALNALGGGRGPVGHALRSCRKRGREKVKRKKAATLAGCRLETVVPA